jgi:general secretion pathway protein D
VEPLISLDDEVGIKVGLEVSNIVREVKSTSNTLTYQIGTRNAATNLRLRDGETQVLAGLISNDDRRTADRVPGLGDLPIAGRLFSSTLDNTSRTEIILLITPRLVRTLARPDAASVEFAAGTEASTGTPRLGAAPPVLPTITAPAVSEETPAPPSQPTLPPTPAGSTPPPTPAGPTIVPFGGIKPTPP